LNIVRRYGTTPQQRGSATGQSCPDIGELENGDFVFIGTHTTDPQIRQWLTTNGGGIAEYERAVILPRDLVLAAARDITEGTA
jgi:hypothetical protein